MSTGVINVNDRVYDKNVSLYGNTQRTMLMGLKDAPVVLMDDGTHNGYVGQTKMTRIVKSDGYDLEGQVYALPLDVRMIGIQYLTVHGVSKEIQATMFANWMKKLTAQQRTEYTALWGTVDKANPTALAGFLDAMVTNLNF